GRGEAACRETGHWVAESLDRQARADEPGRDGERQLAFDTQARGEEVPELGLVPLAHLARPRIRAAARRENGHRPPRRGLEVGPAEADRRRRQAAGRERAGHARRAVRRGEDPEIETPRGLDAGRNRPGPEAGRQAHDLLNRRQVHIERRQRGARVARHAAHGASGSCSSPRSSGSPKRTLNACTAWPAAPLTRLSRTAMTRIRPARSSWWTRTRTSLLPMTCFVAGGAATTSTKRSSPYAAA